MRWARPEAHESSTSRSPTGSCREPYPGGDPHAQAVARRVVAGGEDHADDSPTGGPSQLPQNPTTRWDAAPPAAAFYPHLPHTVTLHLGNASLSGIETRINTRIIPRQRGFPADAHPHHPTPHEQSGLTHGIEALGSGSTGHITLRARASSGLTPRRDPPGRRPRGGDRGEPRW